MTLISYAQNFEDVMLWRALKGVTFGRYVDIGAQDPVIDSVSKAFHDAGWRGTHVEPCPDYAAALRKAFPEDTVIEAAVAAKQGSIKFYEIPGGGLSTARSDIAKFHRDNAGHESIERHVAAITLAQILDELTDGPIHWLKIDVEGLERDVLQGWGDSQKRPWIIVVESTFPTTEKSSHEEWEDLITSKSYNLVYADGLNRFYLHQSQTALSDSFRYPPNVFDGFQLSGTATSWTEKLVRQHEIELANAESQVSVLNERLKRQNAEADKLKIGLADQRLQHQLDQTSAAKDIQRLRVIEQSVGMVQRTNQALEHEKKVAENKFAELLDQLAVQREMIDELKTKSQTQALSLAETANALRNAQEREDIARTEIARLSHELGNKNKQLTVHHKKIDEWKAKYQAQAQDITESSIALRQSEEREEITRNEIVKLTCELVNKTKQLDLEREIGEKWKEKYKILFQKFVDNNYLARIVEEQEGKARNEISQISRELFVKNEKIHELNSLIEELRKICKDQFQSIIDGNWSLRCVEEQEQAARMENSRLSSELATKTEHSVRLRNSLLGLLQEFETLNMSLNRAAGNPCVRLLTWLRVIRIEPQISSDQSQTALQLLEEITSESNQRCQHDRNKDVEPMVEIEITHVNQLLLKNGSDFIEQAYRSVLRRAPDLGGREHFMSRLRSGDSKECILLDIAGSPEARALSCHLSGMSELRARNKRRWLNRSRTINRLEESINRMELSLSEMLVQSHDQIGKIRSRLDSIEATFTSQKFPHDSGRNDCYISDYGNGSPSTLRRSVRDTLDDVTANGPSLFIDELQQAIRSSSEAAVFTNHLL